MSGHRKSVEKNNPQRTLSSLNDKGLPAHKHRRIKTTVPYSGLVKSHCWDLNADLQGFKIALYWKSFLYIFHYVIFDEHHNPIHTIVNMNKILYQLIPCETLLLEKVTRTITQDTVNLLRKRMSDYNVHKKPILDRMLAIRIHSLTFLWPCIFELIVY